MAKIQGIVIAYWFVAVVFLVGFSILGLQYRFTCFSNALPTIPRRRSRMTLPNFSYDIPRNINSSLSVTYVMSKSTLKTDWNPLIKNIFSDNLFSDNLTNIDNAIPETEYLKFKIPQLPLSNTKSNHDFDISMGSFKFVVVHIHFPISDLPSGRPSGRLAIQLTDVEDEKVYAKPTAIVGNDLAVDSITTDSTIKLITGKKNKGVRAKKTVLEYHGLTQSNDGEVHVILVIQAKMMRKIHLKFLDNIDDYSSHTRTVVNPTFDVTDVSAEIGSADDSSLVIMGQDFEFIDEFRGSPIEDGPSSAWISSPGEYGPSRFDITFLERVRAGDDESSRFDITFLDESSRVEGPGDFIGGVEGPGDFIGGDEGPGDFIGGVEGPGDFIGGVEGPGDFIGGVEGPGDFIGGDICEFTVGDTTKYLNLSNYVFLDLNQGIENIRNDEGNELSATVELTFKEEVDVDTFDPPDSMNYKAWRTKNIDEVWLNFEHSNYDRNDEKFVVNIKLPPGSPDVISTAILVQDIDGRRTLATNQYKGEMVVIPPDDLGGNVYPLLSDRWKYSNSSSLVQARSELDVISITSNISTPHFENVPGKLANVTPYNSVLLVYSDVTNHGYISFEVARFGTTGGNILIQAISSQTLADSLMLCTDGIAHMGLSEEGPAAQQSECMELALLPGYYQTDSTQLFLTYVTMHSVGVGGEVHLKIMHNNGQVTLMTYSWNDCNEYLAGDASSGLVVLQDNNLQPYFQSLVSGFNYHRLGDLSVVPDWFQIQIELSEESLVDQQPQCTELTLIPGFYQTNPTQVYLTELLLHSVGVGGEVHLKNIYPAGQIIHPAGHIIHTTYSWNDCNEYLSGDASSGLVILQDNKLDTYFQSIVSGLEYHRQIEV